MHLLEGPDKGHSMIFMKKKNKSPSPLGIRLLNPMIMRLVLYRDAATAAN